MKYVVDYVKKQTYEVEVIADSEEEAKEVAISMIESGQAEPIGHEYGFYVDGTTPTGPEYDFYGITEAGLISL